MIRLLLAGSSPEQAAEETGIPIRTIYRWTGDPIFRAELRRLQDDSMDKATRLTGALLGPAVNTLRAEMQNMDNPASVRVRAADLLISHHVKLLELRDIETRVAKLEAFVYKKGE